MGLGLLILFAASFLIGDQRDQRAWEDPVRVGKDFAEARGIGGADLYYMAKVADRFVATIATAAPISAGTSPDLLVIEIEQDVNRVSYWERLARWLGLSSGLPPARWKVSKVLFEASHAQRWEQLIERMASESSSIEELNEKLLNEVLTQMYENWPKYIEYTKQMQARYEAFDALSDEEQERRRAGYRAAVDVLVAQEATEQLRRIPNVLVQESALYAALFAVDGVQD